VKEDIAKRWVAALRSDEFQQAFGVLRRVAPAPVRGTPCHCTIGVLVELAIADKAVKPWEELTIDGLIVESSVDGCSTNLPWSVVEWGGLRTSGGLFDWEDLTDEQAGNEWPSVTSMNDDGKLTFGQQADYIERNFVRL